MKYHYSCILLIFNLVIRFKYDRIISEGIKIRSSADYI